MSAPPVVEYRTDLVPGQQHFDCEALRATLSTAACAARWKAAEAGTTCHGCALGQQHYAVAHPTERRVHRKPDGTACVRCGRTDLRIIRSQGVCVSCFNRQREIVAGRNSKGTLPVKAVAPHDAEVTIERVDGRIERRLVPAVHDAEVVRRVLRDLPDGARIIAERRLTAWNASTRQFEHVCTRCGETGLVLERVRRGVLEWHHWCCDGDPAGTGWKPAQVRQQLMPMRADVAAAWLSTDPEPPALPGAWRATGHPCVECGAGQIETLLALGGRWKARCNVCGDTSSPP